MVIFQARKGVFDYIRENLNQCNVFSFGIGSSVNRYLIEGVAKAGMGEPFIVTQEAEASAIAAKFREYIQTPLLTDIQDTRPSVLTPTMCTRRSFPICWLNAQ